MGVWVPVALAVVICLAILLAFKYRWIRKLVIRHGDDHLEVHSEDEAQAPRTFETTRSEFIDSEVDSAGVDGYFADTRSKNSRWKIR
jgi:uncharacterized membrane protein